VDRLTAQGRAFSTAAAAMYTDRMIVRRQTSTSGPHGGSIPAPPTILATNVPCRYRPASAQETELAGATFGSAAYYIKAPALQGSRLIEIDARCEVEIAARHGGVPAQVLKVVAPLANQGVAIEFVATKAV